MHAEPATFGEGSPSAAHSFPLQSAATISIPMPSIDDAQPVQPRTPPTPAEIHEAVVAEQGTSRGLAIANAGIESSQEESELSPSASAPSGRPELRTRLSKKLFLKGRERASSLSKLPFVRPKLDRRSAASGSTTPGTPTGDTDDNSPYSPAEANPRRRVLERLQDRFARSAPSSPALTPSASTDRVHLFRSRPSSIVVSGRGVEFNYFTGHLRDVSSSQPSSCDASVYQPALDRIGQWGSTDELVNSASAEIFEDALPKNLFDALLPREVKLKVFSLVVEGCIEEEELITQERSWTASRAARERWIGERAGLRELVKMSRVCREWRDLVFDGQLWQNIHISRTFGCDVFLSSGLVRLASHAGSFLRRLDLRGFSQLQDWDLDDITESCKNHTGFTSLTYIDLSGRLPS